MHLQNAKLCATSSRSPSDANGFISMDLLVPFETTSKGKQYTLTVVCMLTNCVMCVPLADRSTDVVVNAYLRDIYYKFGGSRNIYQTMGVK